MEFENLIRIMKPACGSATALSRIHIYFSNCIIGAYGRTQPICRGRFTVPSADLSASRAHDEMILLHNRVPTFLAELLH